MGDEKGIPKLKSLFVFSTLLNPKEGMEHEKIIYYYPPNTSIDNQVKSMGLIEALGQFSNSFNSKHFRCFHTKKTIQVFLEAAVGYPMVMIVSLPTEHNLTDNICEKILENFYSMFKLFLGPMEIIIQRKGIDGLKQRLNHYFSRCLPVLNLHEADLLQGLNGVPYLALDRTNYLKVHCLLSHVEANFPSVKYTAFLYNDFLVASSLNPDDTCVVYRYLTTHLLPSHNESLSSSTFYPGLANHLGRFVCGPPNLSDETVSGKTPKLYLNVHSSIALSDEQPSAPEEVTLVVYRALRATICLFLSSDVQKPIEFKFFRNVDAYLGPQLTALSNIIKDTLASHNMADVIDSQYQYMCFNSTNHALKSSIHKDGLLRPVPAAICSGQTMTCLALLREELHDSLPTDSAEIIAKTDKDVWLVLKKSSGRELHLINSKVNLLLEVDEESRRFCASQFSNIFFNE